VRIILATNGNLQDMIREGKFRDDLYYRINVLTIHVPPLRRRKDEIPHLCSYFIGKFNRIFKKNIHSISDDTLNALMNYDFPGNVRELQNLIEYACVFCNNGAIEIDHLKSDMKKKLRNAPAKVDVSNHDEDYSEQSDEKRKIIATIIKSGGNKTLAAKKLSMHKTTLFRKIKKYKISPEMLIGSVKTV
jgi:transcriptional regulator with PAS, ATPase and Fis domain